jgi:hypothetical protein
VQILERERVEPLQHEACLADGLGQPRARPLAPAPSRAGDVLGVAPDGLAGVDCLALAVDSGERLASPRQVESERRRDAAPVVAADREDVLDADRVVRVNGAVTEGSSSPRRARRRRLSTDEKYLLGRPQELTALVIARSVGEAPNEEHEGPEPGEALRDLGRDERREQIAHRSEPTPRDHLRYSWR